MRTTLLRNEKVSVTFDTESSDPHISFSDLTDKFNDTRGFTRNKRGLAKAAAFIVQVAADERLKEDITFSDVVKILDNAKLRTHVYCGMD